LQAVAVWIYRIYQSLSVKLHTPTVEMFEGKWLLLGRNRSQVKKNNVSNYHNY